MSKKEQIAFRCSECNELFPKELVDEILKGNTAFCEKCGFPFRSRFTNKEYKKMGSPPIQAPKLKRKQTVAYSKPSDRKKSKKSPKKRKSTSSKQKYRYEPPPKVRLDDRRVAGITIGKNEKVPEQDLKNLKTAIRIMNDIVWIPLIIGILILIGGVLSTTIGPGSLIQTNLYEGITELVVHVFRFTLIVVLWGMNYRIVVRPVQKESYTNLGIDAILIGILGLPFYGLGTFYLFEGIFILLYDIFSRWNNLVEIGKTDELSKEILGANISESSIQVMNGFLVKGTGFLLLYSIMPILKKVRDIDIIIGPTAGQISSLVFYVVFFVVSIVFIGYLRKKFVKKVEITPYQEIPEDMLIQCIVFSSFSLIYAGVGTLGLVLCIFLFSYRKLYKEIKKQLPLMKYTKPQVTPESAKISKPIEKQAPLVPTSHKGKKEEVPTPPPPSDGKKPLQQIPMMRVEDKEARKQLITSLKESEKEKPEKPPSKPPVGDKGDIKEYMDRVFTVLTADMRDRLLKLDIPEDQKWDVIREFVNLKKTQQQKYIKELENVNRVLTEELKKTSSEDETSEERDSIHYQATNDHGSKRASPIRGVSGAYSMSVLLTIKKEKKSMAQNEIPKELKKKQESSSKTVAKAVEEIPFDDVQDSEYKQRITRLREELLSELTPIETDVLGVAKEILKLKKYPSEISVERVELMSPMVDKIYAKAIARFENQKGYKKDAIFSAIQSLESKKWIITSQRTTKAAILKNPIKKEILSFIQKYPGIHARDPKIEEILHITRNPFIKHMATLEAFGLVRSSKIGSTLNYFPSDLPDVFDDLAVLFQNSIVTEIVRSFIEKHMTLMELAEKIGVYHRAIQYHIKTLLSNNVLIEIEPNEVELSPGEKIDSRRKYYRVNSGLLERYNRLFKVPPFVEWL